METKNCSKCKKQKPCSTEYFYRATHTKSGYQSWCIECCSTDEMMEYKRKASEKWRKKHPEKWNEVYRNWRRKNKEKATQYVYEWMKNNTEPTLNIQKKYQQAEPPGVYAIKYVDDVIYVGATNEPVRRSNIHFSMIKTRNNIGKINKLHSFYGYDKKDFTFEILEHCDIDQLITKEKEWRVKLNSKANYERLFNIKETIDQLIDRLGLTKSKEKTWRNPGK